MKQRLTELEKQGKAAKFLRDFYKHCTAQRRSGESVR
jgi:hypothetical protein